MKHRSVTWIIPLAMSWAVSSWPARADQTAELDFVISTEYARPFSSIETHNARKWLLGPTGIFAYGPYGPSFYLHHYKEYTRDRNWFVVLSTIPDSPAVGLVRKDDVITGANGKSFPKDEDARVHLGRAVLDSEAKDGVLRLSVNRKGKDLEVDIQLTPIGGLSPTWPFDCPRTDRMITDACRFLQEEQLPDGFIPADEANIGTTHGGLLFLATGEPQYLENARRAAYWFIDHATEKEQKGERLEWGPWFGSYATILLAEYYEMTGDRGVLPGMELAAKQIARGQMPSGGWGHGYFNGFTAGYGEVNNCGITCYMALVLAKECGVTVDEVALAKARAYFGAFGPAVASQYGDHDLKIDGYAAWNGHMGELATVHRLEGNTEFAEAYALKVARSLDRVEDGHTGCFMSIVWSPIAASLAPAEDYRWGMDQFDWYYALSREPRGGFYCQPGGDNLQRTGGEYSLVGENMSTGGFCLALAAPRRHLRILGAPKSVFVRELPAPLKAARELHQSHQWDACIGAIDAFLAAAEEKSMDPGTIRTANELRDKSRYVRTGVTGTLARIEKMLSVKNQRLDLRAYEIKHMLGSLQGLLGKEDARLQSIAERLPYDDQLVYQKGKAYYEACKTLKYHRMELWFPYGRFAQQNSRWMVVEPRDEWRVIYDMNEAQQAPRYFAIKVGDALPDGWQTLEFDDTAWPEKVVQGESSDYSRSCVRIPFELEPTALLGLRLAVAAKSHFPTGARVYLNGELVLKSNSRLEGKATFLTSTVNLLKPGRNVVAIESPYLNRIPMVQLEAELLDDEGAFAWTPVPGRDAEIRTLTSARLMPQPYYDVEQDQRTVKELMAVFHQTPSFMPELFYAQQRFNAVVPVEDRAAHVQELLGSPAWGGRLIGLMVLGEGVIEPTKDKLSQDEFETVKATFQRLRHQYDPFQRKAAALLRDPHPLVRVMAARAVAGYGDAAKESIPTLIELLRDVDGQHWWVRESAYKALNGMSLDRDTKRSITLIALKDPSASVRRHPLTETARVKDPEECLKAMLEYREAMIDQVFDAPLGMWTSHTRKTIAPKLKGFGKDVLRPHIPRFMESLKDDTGGRLEGSSELLAWFGEEVIDQVDALVDGTDPVTRVNAIKLLVRMATDEAATDDLAQRVVKRLEGVQEDEDIPVSRAAKEGLKQIAAQEGSGK